MIKKDFFKDLFETENENQPVKSLPEICTIGQHLTENESTQPKSVKAEDEIFKTANDIAEGDSNTFWLILGCMTFFIVMAGFYFLLGL